MNAMPRSRFSGLAAIFLGSSIGLGSVCQSSGQPQHSTEPQSPTQRPSIILILADDLGYGDLGCYGQTRIKTPNIDKLAAEGIRFTDFYAGSTVCAPSRAALMLGKHTGHLNIRGNAAGMALQPDEITVAKLLKEAGYRTGLIGKWGLGDEGSTGVPAKQGFEDFVGYLNQTHAHDYYTDRLWHTDPRAEWDKWQYFSENQNGKKSLYTHDLFTTGALNFIKINKPDQFNNHRPFFLFLAYTVPHANNEEGRRTGNGMQVPSDEPYSRETWQQPEKNKAAMITRLDADIGRLMERLKQSKVDDNTVIFFTSDNGPHKEGGVDPKFFTSSGPLRGIKRDLYEGGIRVPMIVRWPAKIKPGQVSDFVWANWDFLPTAADIAMAKPPKGIDGLSVLPLLTGQEQTNRHDFLYWEFHERGFQQAARADDWKAVRPQAGEKLELYNLERDPSEKENVSEKNPEVVEKFDKYFKMARTESPRWSVKKPAANRTEAKPEKPAGATPPGK
jgi:arylsulfatase A-like enzyme